jgi:general secretion pathway protein D
MPAFRHFAVLSFSLTAMLLAQEPIAPPIAPPGVPSIPQDLPLPPPIIPPANIANAAPPAAVLGDSKITEPIEEPKLSGDALAGLYRKYTGRRVIVSSAAAIAEFRFVQDASPQDPLTFEEAAELLKIAATLENFVFVPDSQNPNLDILTLSTGGIRPSTRGVEVYNENRPLPEGDAVISYVMTLNYIKPAEAVSTFVQIVGQLSAFGSIAPVPNASAVVITENTSLIRKLIDLKKEIDKPSSQVGTRFIKVQYADVTEIAATLTELLTAQQSNQATAGIQRAESGQPVNIAPPGVPVPPGSAGPGGEAPPVQIVPDPRTNRIFAMGRPVDLLFIEGLVREFDVETSEKNFLRRKLKFLTVSDFLPIAADALGRAFGSGDGGSGGGASPQAQPQPGRNGQANNGGGGGGRQGGIGRSGSGSSGSSRGGSRGGGNTNFGGGGGSSGGGGGGSSLDSPEVSSAPESKLVGRTLLVADNITNSIVVQGPPSGLEIIERLLDQIDVKPDQVMISTVIGQLTLSKDRSLGLDYLKLGNDFVARGGGGFGPVLPILPVAGTGGVAAFNPGTFGPAAGLQVYGKIGNNLNAYLNALQSRSDFTVLSRPSIFTSNNQKGTISSGERIAIPTSSNSFSSGGASTNIEYQDVVLKLEVVPLVNSEREITMQIALLNDEQNGTQTIAGAGSNGTNLTVPRISTREILTTVTVPNNETIVLGGLIINRGGEGKSGIPILSDIPYLGRIFSTTTENKSRSELMVFMQPSIVSSDRSLNAVQADMDARYKTSGDARRFADGPGVLPPVDAISPMDDQQPALSATGKRPKAIIIPPASAATAIPMKASIRPNHRN